MADADDTTRLVAGILQRTLEQLPSDAEIRPDDRLADLDVSSMQIMMIIVEIEKTFGLQLPDSALAIETFETVSSVAGVVDSVRAGGAVG